MALYEAVNAQEQTLIKLDDDTAMIHPSIIEQLPINESLMFK